jgi:hypothetical protein
VAIQYGRRESEEHALRPRRAPRRTGPVALPIGESTGGQTTLSITDREQRYRRAQTVRCPKCWAPVGRPCTRRPGYGETQRQTLGYAAHPARERAAEVDA